LLAALAVLLAAGAAAPGASADHTSGHWHDRTVVVRDETGFADHRRALDLAVRQWNAAGAAVRLELASGRGAGCDAPQAGEISVCRADLPPSRAGEARVWKQGDHIVRASVLVRADSWRFEHLVAIACHELGHALGLDHRSERTSCLTATIHSSQPDEHDLADLRAAHAHTEEVPPSAQPAPSDASEPSPCPLLRLNGSCVMSTHHAHGR
jgi:hypothetical protein